MWNNKTGKEAVQKFPALVKKKNKNKLAENFRALRDIEKRESEKNFVRLCINSELTSSQDQN